LGTSTPRILVTGAVGQIGSELTVALRDLYGRANVIAAGHRTPPQPELLESGPFIRIDVTDREQLDNAVRDLEIDTVYHLAAILSVAGEANPQLAWRVNIDGLVNVLEVGRDRQLARLFVPSSIAVFGPETPRDPAPQETILRPTTIYGASKVAGELLCEYYARKYSLDVRGMRYPGIISSETPPGGGTTDYAVAIFHEAISRGRYTCYLREDTVLPMMYMPDCIKATIDLMNADPTTLIHHADFNVAAMSFSAGQLADAIRRHIPGFVCEFAPDARQAIADSWPQTIDDTPARMEWAWEPAYDLETMVRDMLDRLGARRA